MANQYRSHTPFTEHIPYAVYPVVTATYEQHVGYNAHIFYGGAGDPSDRTTYNETGIGYEEHILYTGGVVGNPIDDSSNQFSQITGTATASLVTAVTLVFGTVSFAGTGTAIFGGFIPTVVTGSVTFAGEGSIAITGTIIFPAGTFTKALDYRVVICDLNNVSLDEVNFSNLSLGYALNDAGTITFTLPLTDSKTTRDLLEPGQRTIKVFRNGQKVWGGYLTGASPSFQSGTVDFRGDGWFSRFKHRIIDSDLIFEDVDQLRIVKNIIDYAQTRTGGDYGIQWQGPTNSNVNRTRRYHAYERVNIGDEIQTLSALHNGFDFDITPDRTFQTYTPRKGSASNNYLFELETNISDFSQDLSADDIVSEVTALGGGSGNNRCLAVVADSDTLTNYGLLQEALDVSKIKHFPDLIDAAKEELRVHKNLRQLPQITIETSDPPFSGAYDIGDEVRVKANYGYIKLNRNLRIVSMTVDVSEAGKETVNAVLDEPFVEA